MSNNGGLLNILLNKINPKLLTSVILHGICDSKKRLDLYISNTGSVHDALVL